MLVAIPFVVSAVSAIGAHWNPSGDLAIEAMRIRDVGGAHTPLVGLWSRWGWSHPGPAFFWFLAPFSRGLGNDGILIGTGVLNLGAAIGVVLVAARVSPTAGLLAGASTGLLAHGVGGELLIDPWSPRVPVFPFLLFLIVVWVVRCGQHQWLVGAVAVGSLVAQTHASYAPLVGTVLAFGALCVVRVATARGAGPPTVEPGRERRRAWMHLGLALLLALVLWLPPLAQQLFDSPGNLSEIARYVRSDETHAGWGLAVGTMGTQVRPAGPWITDDESDYLGFERQTSALIALATIGATAGLGLAAARRGQHAAAQLAAVALLAIAAGLVSTARATGPLFPYVVGYWRPIAALTFFSIAYSAVVLVGTRHTKLTASIAGLIALALTGALAIVAYPVQVPAANLSRAIGAVGPKTAQALRRDARYLVAGRDVATLDGGSTGLLLYLEARGFHAFREKAPLTALVFGEQRVGTTASADGRIIMASLAAVRSGWQPPGGARVVAAWDPLTHEARARARTLGARIRRHTGMAPEAILMVGALAQRDHAVQQGARRRDVDDLGRLQRQGDAYRIYLSPI